MKLNHTYGDFTEQRQAEQGEALCAPPPPRALGAAIPFWVIRHHRPFSIYVKSKQTYVTKMTDTNMSVVFSFETDSVNC